MPLPCLLHTWIQWIQTRFQAKLFSGCSPNNPDVFTNLQPNMMTTGRTRTFFCLSHAVLQINSRNSIGL